jgi:predicted dehydrogenase
MYLPSLRSHPSAELVAICGRNQGRTQEMAVKYGIAKTFTDHEEMIDQGDLDAIIVGVPDDLHYEVTLHGLRAGLHVLCDKPLAITAQQARKMYEEAEAARVKHFEIFNQQSAGCRSFIDAILGDQPATPTFFDGYKTQQVMDAAIEAHRAGHWVTIEDSPGTSVQ